MHQVIAGTGYTGKRVFKLLDHAMSIGRRRAEGQDDDRFIARDLDHDTIQGIDIEPPWSMLYTVPPSPIHPGDNRLQTLLDALQSPPARIVYLSTIGVYGDRGGALTDETVAPAPQQPRTKRRVAAETLLADYAAAQSADLVILRLPGIYGPGRLGLQRIREGGSIIQEADALPGNRIHVDDLARCCVAALDPGTPAGTYNVGDGDYRSGSWFAMKTAELAGCPAPRQVSRDQATKEFSRRRMSFLGEARRIDTSKMREVLGVVPEYDNPEDGIRASLAEDGELATASDQG